MVRIATRSSPLALWQAHHVADLLRTLDPETDPEIVHIRTEGDRNQTDQLRQFGGLGVFTREVQRAVLNGDCHIAVHSLKDLPTTSAEGLKLGCVPGRASRFDALVLPADSETDLASLRSVSELPQGMRIGTGSPRRQAQLRHYNPNLSLLEIRGNVDTRLRKLDDGEFDAVVLAEAGLIRLNHADRISVRLQPPEVFPAVGQGALGIECRADDESTLNLLQQLTDPVSLAEVTAERSLLRHLRAGCHAPVGTLAAVTDNTLQLTAVLFSEDGMTRLIAEADSAPSSAEAEQLGIRVADQLIADGGDEFLHASDDD